MYSFSLAQFYIKNTCRFSLNAYTLDNKHIKILQNQGKKFSVLKLDEKVINRSSKTHLLHWEYIEMLGRPMYVWIC